MVEKDRWPQRWLLWALDLGTTKATLNKLSEENWMFRIVSTGTEDTLWGERFNFLVELPTGEFRAVYAELLPQNKERMVEYLTRSGKKIGYARVKKIDSLYLLVEGDYTVFLQQRSKYSVKKEGLADV